MLNEIIETIKQCEYYYHNAPSLGDSVCEIKLGSLVIKRKGVVVKGGMDGMFSFTVFLPVGGDGPVKLSKLHFGRRANVL